MPAVSAPSEWNHQASVGRSDSETPGCARAASMKSATGSSPRLPISTCTCTPSDTHAISDTSASPRANTVATAAPDPNDHRSRERGRAASRPLSPPGGERVG